VSYKFTENFSIKEERLVKECHELLKKYNDGDHKQRIEELIDNVTVYDSPMSFKKMRG
jgi:hypothetical protein